MAAAASSLNQQAANLVQAVNVFRLQPGATAVAVAPAPVKKVQPAAASSPKPKAAKAPAPVAARSSASAAPKVATGSKTVAPPPASDDGWDTF